MTDSPATSMMDSLATAIPHVAGRLLVGTDGGLRAIPLPANRGVLIGRGRTCDVQLAGPGVSRSHARLERDGDWWICDAGSANGTFVRGRRLAPAERVSVTAGDAISLGGVLVVLDESDPEDAVDTLGGIRQLACQHDLRTMCATGLAVLLVGEPGVGKALSASAIHRASPRAAGPLVTVNCSAYSATTLELELFGRARGVVAADPDERLGAFELASGGTLLIENIGAMPLPVQHRVHRVLSQRAVVRLGGMRARQVDVRWLATNPGRLDGDVAAGRFDPNLYGWLADQVFVVPPLRERLSELPRLVDELLRDATLEHGRGQSPRVTPEAMRVLAAHPWPGNVLELRHVLDCAVLLATDGMIQVGDLRMLPEHFAAASPEDDGPFPGAGDAMKVASLRDAIARLERQRIIEVLTAHGGNQSRAAKVLGMSRGTLQARMDAYDIPRPRKREAELERGSPHGA
jgi:DNA-binding NtrC family response regulator